MTKHVTSTEKVISEKAQQDDFEMVNEENMDILLKLHWEKMSNKSIWSSQQRKLKASPVLP
jgi:hypothetical protein